MALQSPIDTLTLVVGRGVQKARSLVQSARILLATTRSDNSELNVGLELSKPDIGGLVAGFFSQNL